MIVKRIVRNKEGEIEAVLMLTGEQAAFLLNVGLGALVQRGAATLMDFSEEEFEEHVKEQQAAEAEQVVAPTEAPATQVQPEKGTTVVPVEPNKEEMLRFLQSVDPDLMHKA
jgi:hypothetical protein